MVHLMVILIFFSFERDPVSPEPEEGADYEILSVEI